MRAILVISILCFSLGSQVTSSLAKSASFAGSWHGGGVVKPHNQATEKTRCRATVRQASASSFTARYSCSSSIGVATQNVRVRKVGTNVYSGSFYNSQHNVRGVVNITVRGNSHSVSLRSAKGTGYIKMRKR
ncbi:MAG: hypothetical protein L3J67_02155 [Hyphomicrobiaceae bacterium]|nr:hypothetical protein [Hyphomicrobiaceae bacterium]